MFKKIKWEASDFDTFFQILYAHPWAGDLISTRSAHEFRAMGLVDDSGNGKWKATAKGHEWSRHLLNFLSSTQEGHYQG